MEENGLFTMGDIARCSMGKDTDYYNEELLYKMFGINAELLIDHAWGWEPCTIADVKGYKPDKSSMGSGQVLQRPYDFEKARLIVREMTDLLVLDLVEFFFHSSPFIEILYIPEYYIDISRNMRYLETVQTDEGTRKRPARSVALPSRPFRVLVQVQIVHPIVPLLDGSRQPSKTI